MTFSATTSILSQVGPNILDGNVLEPLGRFAEGRRPGVKRNNDGERSSESLYYFYHKIKIISNRFTPIAQINLFILVPHFLQLPLSMLRPFLEVTFLQFVMGMWFFLHLTQ